MFAEMLVSVREKSPIVHNITNYVTVNDCANILLACGASPIMADDIEEAADITSICAALNINIGTLNKNTIPSMFAAGKKANELAHPVLLDPVGAGASLLRTNTAAELVREIKFSVIRGNISEIKALFSGTASTRGVDASELDAISEKNLDEAVKYVKSVAAENDCIIAVTGAIDIVADKEKAYIITNGHPIMSRITGSGCMLSAMITAYIAANPENMLCAAAAAVAAMGLCGEKAKLRMNEKDGNSSFRNYLIDEIFNLTPQALKEGAKYEIR